MSGNLDGVFPGGRVPPVETGATILRLAEHRFAQALAEAGLRLAGPPVADGRLHRVPSADDRRGERAGWYVFHADGVPAGAFGDFRAGLTQSWCAVDVEALDPAARAAHAERMAGARGAREAAQAQIWAEAAARARTLWASCSPADPAHPYLVAKGVPALGARQDPDGNLVLPVHGPDGALWSVQRIPANGGAKRFLAGGRTAGGSWRIDPPGAPPSAGAPPVLYLAEGFATAATVSGCTGAPVVVAYSAGNLAAIARELRRQHPGARLVLAADNDHATEARTGENPGVRHAREAAAATGAEVLVPPFAAGEPGSDWNDFARLHGPERARALLAPPATGLASQLVSAAALAELPVPEQAWLLPDWIPLAETTALYGDGGTGKTLLAQQLMTCVASATPFFGLTPRAGPALGFFCEDSTATLHARQAAICAGTGLPLWSLKALQWLSRKGKDNLLMVFDRDVGRLTPLWTELRALVLELQPVLLVVDTAADTFGGNENVRPQVRQYIQQALTALAEEAGAAVLLCAHPSAAGLAAGTGTGGSTAWSNSVRSRLYFWRDPDTGRRILEVKKANYGKDGGRLELFWSQGLFLPYVQADGALASSDEAGDARRDFLTLLRLCERQQINVGPARQGNYAPRAFAKMGRSLGIQRPPGQYEQAMFELLAAGRIGLVEGFGDTHGRRLGVLDPGTPSEGAPEP